jgi:hypothetical protein
MTYIQLLWLWHTLFRFQTKSKTLPKETRSQINTPCLENAYVPCTNQRAVSGECLRSLYKSSRPVWRIPTFLVQINAPCLENAYVPCTNQRAVSGECLRSLYKSTRPVWRMPTFLVHINAPCLENDYVHCYKERRHSPDTARWFVQGT